jgi:hypothetical protein
MEQAIKEFCQPLDWVQILQFEKPHRKPQILVVYVGFIPMKHRVPGFSPP